MAVSQETLTFTPEKLMAFKILYERHKNQTEPFAFEGKEYTPNYAKYLIEHLDNELNRANNTATPHESSYSNRSTYM